MNVNSLLRHVLLTTTVTGAVLAGGCGSNSANVTGSGGALGSGGVRGSGGAPGSGGQTQGTGGAIGGGGGGGGQAGASDDLTQIIANYEKWQPQSDTPVDISQDIFALCRLPTAAENNFVDSVHGGHGLRDWANPAAAATISAGRTSTSFAVGAAIVKQKFVRPPGSVTWELVALGIMIKRVPGFAPAAGDWEFAYDDIVSGTISRGPSQLAACGACHSGASATDFVFIDNAWRLVGAR